MGRNRDKYRNRPDLREIDDPERYFEDDVIKASVNNAAVPDETPAARDAKFFIGELKKAGERIDALEAKNRKLSTRLFVTRWLLLVGGFGIAAVTAWKVFGQ